ncbi:hypothetical protein AKH04_04845 [Vibrio parahaemolyticus]|nr:hypothetical protein AKH04_04845 [Vibrio parahaemolyticus]
MLYQLGSVTTKYTKMLTVHPDWLHVAEDATGSHPKEKLDVQAGDTPTQKHALKAILKHMNDWATDKLSSNPDIETNAVESEIELKK